MDIDEIISEIRITVNGNLSSAYYPAKDEETAALAVQAIKKYGILPASHYCFAVYGKIFVRRKPHR